MASRRSSRDQFLSPNRVKMPDVFVIQDYSVNTNSGQLSPPGHSGGLHPPPTGGLFPPPTGGLFPPPIGLHPSTAGLFPPTGGPHPLHAQGGGGFHFPPPMGGGGLFPQPLQTCTSPTFGGFLSPGSIDSLNKRSNSTVSSIFDLSIESDQLERALKENDPNAVAKFLQVHYGKFPLSLHGSAGGTDRCSNESRSRRPSSRASAQDTDLFFRKPQPIHIDRFEMDRRESVTPECDIPDIFRTSIHVAILHNSIDVIRVLLKYGIDPNEPSANLLHSERRLSTFHTDCCKLRPDCVIEETLEQYSADNMSNSNSSREALVVPGQSILLDEMVDRKQSDTSLLSDRPRATFVINPDHDLSYAQDELMKLPPLFIAVQEKRDAVVFLLLESGADPNSQDRLGNSPLHLAATETYYNTDVCTELLKRGAKLRLTNLQGQTPFDFRKGLVDLQKTVIKDMLSSTNMDKSIERLKVNGKRVSWSSNSSNSNSRSFGRSGSIKKKLFRRSESKEKERAARERRRNERLESTSTAATDTHFEYSIASSSHRSSRGRLHSTAITEDMDSGDTLYLQVPILYNDGSSSDRSAGRSVVSSNDRSTSGKSITSRMSLRRGEKSKHRNSCAVEGGERSSIEETEKSLRALIKLAANPECVSSLVEGLGNYMKLVLALTEQADSPSVETAITNLFNTIIQTIYEQLKDAKSSEERIDHFYDLSRLLFIAFELLKGKQSLHYTALCTVNRVIDICVIYRNYEVTAFTKSAEQVSTHDLYKNASPKRKSSQFHSDENAALNRHFSLNRKERRASTHDAHSKSDTHEKEEREDSKSSSISNCTQVHRTPLDILTSWDPSQILSILHNNITMHKRIIGTRQKCTPSTRWRQCTHHCLQILSARILTVMCHGPNVQHKLVNEGHAKTLVEALDPNHDPHLLCLLLQSLSSIALNPSYHQVLAEADIADMLMQLLLPSDEWYYTNHSTKYAKYVKYHAARILVYIGQLHRLGGRVDLFDTKMFQDGEATNPILQVNSPEDSFIELMALGSIVMWNEKHHIEAASLEGLITHIIEEAVVEDLEDRNGSPRISDSSSIQSFLALKGHNDFTTPTVSPTCSVQTLNNVGHKSFREFLFMALPMIVHPVIILRLLAHKMFGNMIRRKTVCGQDTKLKPPKEENLIVEVKCPPRSNSDVSKHEQRMNMKRVKDSKTTIQEAPRASKHATVSSNDNKNGTNMALKAIGESLVTPLELNITSGHTPEPSFEHKPVCMTQSESFKGSRSKLFRWQSKKHLSKSQVNMTDLCVAQDDPVFIKVDSDPSSMHDVDIIAFQRELINLPTFVMDTPLDISPVFSRSSSVPENLASRLNPASGSLCQLSTHSSRKRLSKSGCGSEQAVSALVHSGSAVTITMTDANHHDSIFFLPSEESTTDTPDDSMANIIVHFDPPQSPLLSSASGSPQAFDFPPPPSFTNNFLQPLAQSSTSGAIAQAASNKGSNLADLPQLVTKSLSEHSEEISDSKSSLARPEILKVSPMTSPINEMSIAHQGVLTVLETWISVCQTDLEGSSLVVHEMREFLKKLSVLGPEYKVWCQKMSGALHLEEKGSADQSNESPDDAIHIQYKQLQDLILAGELPCSKEEAATLAGIQLHLEEAWPENETANHNGPYQILDKKMTDKSHTRKSSSNEEKQENLRKRKELIRNNKARGITLSRRKGRLVRQLSCVSDNDPDVNVDIDLTKYLPPLYTTSKKVKHLIEEKQRKLWHTPFYDSEVQLKRLYIKICKNLPCFGCKLYHVKELLKGNTQKKVNRLLGISSEKVILLDNKTKILAKTQNICDLEEWRTGSGKSHDGLVLEFRGTKTWTLSMLSPDSLKSVTAVLWDALDMHGRFLNSSTLRRESFEFDFQRKQLTLCPDNEGLSRYTKELEGLQKLLHFPEEVAVLLTETESQLFQSVPPADYIRQVTVDLSRGTSVNAKISGVEDLIHRFNEVSTWITQLIITQPTHDNRKAVLSCILRLAHYCWCLGNFNSAMEILAGLKSEKLKPFWLLLSDEDLSTLHTLSAAMFSREPTSEYRDAVSASLDIRDCKVVPFFGGFLRDLRSVVTSSPSIVVLPSSSSDHSIEFLSEFNGEDRFMTRIGVGGLINMDKLKKAHSILTDIQLFQYHTSLIVNNDAGGQQAYSSTDWADEVFEPCDSHESDTELDFDSYQPIKQLSSGHDVMIITPSFAHLSHQCLQFMNHGSTLVHLEEESGRTCMCFLRLEADNATLTWKKPNWSALRGNSSSLPDYVLRGDFDYSSIQAMYTRYCGGEYVFDGMEEGYLDITMLKDVIWANDDDIDLSAVSKRYGMDDISAERNCICLTYGYSLAENKHLHFVGPGNVVKIWFNGVQKLCQAAKKLRKQIDKRIQWLKMQYLQLYYENEKCQRPTSAEAIRVFGGRHWTPSGPQVSGNLSDSTSSFKRTSSFVVGSNIFKKKPSSSFQSTKEPSPKPFQSRDGSSVSLGKRSKRSPSPQARGSNRQSIASTTTNCDTVSDTNVNMPSPKHGGSLRSQSHPCTSSYLNRYRTRRRTSMLGKNMQGENKNNSITHSTRVSFFDFVDLFRSFALRIRKDLRDLFEQFSIGKPSGLKPGRQSSHSISAEANVLTRNTKYDLQHSTEAAYLQRRKICDAFAVTSIFENRAGVDTSQNKCLGLKEFREFLEDYQEEHLDDSEIEALVRRHEPDPILRENGFLSFEGFAKYLIDKDNYAYLYEKTKHNDEDMDHPLAHYYIGSSHNTYLTAHQLKGDSSVELYSQILLTGCRCVELDCWDGDDGLPIIYHGHTLTTKISFKAVVEAINRSAFVASPYPVILSLENHCSISQQQTMAHIFTSVFGDKLVTQFLFETDFTDDPVLPSPNQLKYKILVKNKKLWGEGEQHSAAKRASAFSRNYSMVLTESGASHEFDYEDDDDDEEDDVTDVKDSRRSVDSQESRTTPDTEDKDGMHPSGSCGDLNRRASGVFNEKNRPKSHPELDWQFDDDITQETVKGQPKNKTKKASQIAKELSDLVVYLRAVKFRGLNVSPNSSLKQRYTKPGTAKKIHGGLAGTPPASLDRPDHNMNTSISLRQKRPDSTPSCYLVSSLNENKTKQLCRRNPNLVIKEKQLMRTYPAGMRIDSSNFNPVLFWAFGIQMVALNYQTEDTAIAINTAMFEQNGQSGYVLKPAVTWDKSHVMYNRFNPLDKEFDGLHTTVLTLHVISGQYVSTNFNASTQVEVEIIGIPVDCAKHKTKVISKNSLNPIWNDVFTFQVMYSELAFIRFVVYDTIASHTVSQRVIPLKCVRPGYRHVRLRNLNNQPLELASIFIYSKHEEELLESCSRQEYNASQESAVLKSFFAKVKDLSEVGKDGRYVHMVNSVAPKLKRRMFFISVFGVTAPDEYVILKVTQDTSVYDAIAKALAKAGRSDEKVADHVLVEDVQNSWEKKKEQERSSSQRILSMSEKVMQAQNKWKGAGMFVLRKVSTDPSSRAWVSTMLSKEQRRKYDGTNSPSGDWDKDEHMFLVCVYNVSPDQPYTIFKAPISSTAQDIITQAMMKAHRSDEEDPRNFFLLEEIDILTDAHMTAGKKRDSEKVFRRILASDESVYHAQSEWKTNGRFVLVDRDMVELDQDIVPTPYDKRKKSIQVKGPMLQQSTMTSTLAKKFCSKLAKSDLPDNTILPEDSPPVPKSPSGTDSPPSLPINLPLLPNYAPPNIPYQPASPSPSTSQSSSSKWKRILKLGNK